MLASTLPRYLSNPIDQKIKLKRKSLDKFVDMMLTHYWKQDEQDDISEDEEGGGLKCLSCSNAKISAKLKSIAQLKASIF